MRDDRHTRIKKQEAYAQTILLDALRVGGLEQAMKVRNDLINILYASISNFEIADLFREEIDEYYRETSKDIDASQLIRAIFKGASESVLNVLCFMAENRDLYLCGAMYYSYTRLLEEKFDVVIVDVTTVVALDDHLRDLIKDKMQADFEKDIILHEHIDESMLGGVMLHAKNRTIDSSLLSILEKTKSELTSVHYYG